jgi:hypothetical protein
VVPYTNATAYAALKLARAAYCDVDLVGNWTCAACEPSTGIKVYELVHHSLSDSFAFVAWDESTQTAAVVFRGSSNILNWLFDVDAGRGGLAPMLPDVPGVEIHLGFRASIIEMKVRTLKARIFWGRFSFWCVSVVDFCLRISLVVAGGGL